MRRTGDERASSVLRIVRFLITAMVATVAVIAGPVGAATHAPRGCPLPAIPYSVAMPVYDIVQDPAAVAAVEAVAPGLLAKIPAAMKSTELPSLAAVLSLPFYARLGLVPGDRLDAIDGALAKVMPSAEGLRARCARYEKESVTVPPPPPHRPAILIFDKSTGYRDAPSVAAADAMFGAISARNDWGITRVSSAAAIIPAVLKQYDAVVWNNVSGDVLDRAQRAALRAYVERGGGFVGIHGSGGDPYYFWDWYADTLIGARFVGHTLAPQFQSARVVTEDTASAITHGLPTDWTMNDEWYSFKVSPRTTGAHVLARLDEGTYKPTMMGAAIAMGDHPIAWTRCVRSGRSFYTAIGHRPTSYSEPNTVRMIEQATMWAIGRGETHCRNGVETR